MWSPAEVVSRELAQVAFVKLPHMRHPWLVVMYVGKPSLCNSIVDVSYQRAREQGLALPLGISENGPNPNQFQACYYVASIVGKGGGERRLHLCDYRATALRP